MPDGTMSPEQPIQYNPALPKDSISPGRGPGMFNFEKKVNYMMTDPDIDPDAQAERYRSGMESSRNLGWEETSARRQPEVSNLATAESPKTVDRALKLLRTAEDRQFIMVEDQYGLRMAGQIASSGYETFSMTVEELLEQDIITVGVGPDGYLLPEAEILEHGYSIAVDREVENTVQTSARETFDTDPGSGGGGVSGKKKWERKIVSIPVENVYFGTNEEREALSEAYKGLRDHIAIRVMLQQLWLNFEDNKANLGGIVGPMYLGKLKFTNAQLERMFTLPDISKITKDSPENREFGDNMDLALTLFDMVGMCETKEKMEEFMNTGSYKYLVQRFGQPVMNKMIGSVDDWYNIDQRRQNGGSKAYEKETENKKRGDLTQFGNIYSKGSTDNEKAVVTLVEKLVGDKDAVNVAYRWFKVSGMVDEMGLEKYGDIPSMEEMVAFREAHSYEEWQTYAKNILQQFSLPGEPVGSDLSKIMWPMYYRLKDYLRDRPCGPGITIDKFERLALGLLSLGRVKVNGELETMHRIWRGYGGKKHTKLGDVGWQKVDTTTFDIEGDNLGGLVEDEAINDNIWTLYSLVNWLTGDDAGSSAGETRLWKVLLNEELPQSVVGDKYFTGLNKYMGIIFSILGKDIEKAKQDLWTGVRSLTMYRYTRMVDTWNGSMPIKKAIQLIAHENATKYGFTKKEDAFDKTQNKKGLFG